MEAADIWLTKPGGLCTTEAMHKGTPIILFNAVPGVETRNLEFLTGIGYAAAAEDAAAIAALVCKSPVPRKSTFDGLAGERICRIIFKKELSG